MRTRELGLGLVSLVGLIAVGASCGNTITKTSSQGGAGTSATGTNTVATTGGPSTNATGTSTGGPATGTSTGGPATGTSTGSGVTCMPAPGDTACFTCAKASCCPDITTCSGDPTCTCWFSCVQGNPNPSVMQLQACYGMCGMPDTATTTLGQCVGGSCQAQCTGGMTTTTTSTGSIMTSVASSSTGMPMCPLAGTDTACVKCAKTNCCAQYDTCAGDAKCVCWAACIQNGGTIGSCTTQCGQADAAVLGLGQCTNTNQCPCGAAGG